MPPLSESELFDLAGPAARRHHLELERVVAVIMAESRGDPAARRREPHLEDEEHPAGVASVGLMQVLETTARDHGWDGDREKLELPQVQVEIGCAYLAWCFGNYPEIPDHEERWRFSHAAYNAGRGTINTALAAARGAERVVDERWPPPPGFWCEWWFASHWLGELQQRITVPYLVRIYRYLSRYRADRR